MATKRMLYKPAQANVGKKRNRRPLAQGRLVTAAPQSAAAGPRLPQGEVNESEIFTENQVSFLTYPTGDDPNATPRRAVPRATTHRSPLPSPPAPTLDLSDNEEDFLSAQTTPQALRGPARGTRLLSDGEVPLTHHGQVMVLDASALGRSINRAEVDCVVGYERSPATVINHQSSGLNSPRGRREENPAWHVPVSQVPRMNDSGSGGAISPLSSPALHAGPKMRQPNFEESGESEQHSGDRETVKYGVTPAPHDALSDSDTCSLFEYVPQASSRPPAGASSKMKQPPKSEKKRKGERTVPSRYMQSAVTKKVSSSSGLAEKNSRTQRSLNLVTSSNNGSGLTSTSNNSGTALRSSASRNKTPSRPQLTRAGARTVSASPSRGKTRVPQGKTSTPTHEDVSIMASCDASAINPELSILSAIDASHMRIGGNSGSGRYGSSSPQKQAKKVDPRVQQRQLDLTYARYLHWLFLDAKAAKMLDLLDKDAMKQMHALWQMTEEKRREKSQLQAEVTKLRHLSLVDHLLEAQEGGLERISGVLPTLQKDYTELAASLDTTRHQILTAGVHLPADQDFYLASLEQVLEDSEQLLGSLSLRTKQQTPAIMDFADAIQAVQKAVDAECKELYRCGELMSAVQSLSTHENSLRIQALQADR